MGVAEADLELIRQELAEAKDKVAEVAISCNLQFSKIASMSAEGELFSLDSPMKRAFTGFYNEIDMERSTLTDAVARYAQGYLEQVTHLSTLVKLGDHSQDVRKSVTALKNQEELILIMEGAAANYIKLDDSLTKGPTGPLVKKNPPSFKMQFKDGKVRAKEKIKTATNLALAAKVLAKTAEVFQDCILFSRERISRNNIERLAALQIDIEGFFEEIEMSKSTVESQVVSNVLIRNEEEKTQFQKKCVKKFRVMLVEADKVYTAANALLQRAVVIKALVLSRFEELPYTI